MLTSEWFPSIHSSCALWKQHGSSWFRYTEGVSDVESQVFCSVNVPASLDHSHLKWEVGLLSLTYMTVFLFSVCYICSLWFFFPFSVFFDIFMVSKIIYLHYPRKLLVIHKNMIIKRSNNLEADGVNYIKPFFIPLLPMLVPWAKLSTTWYPLLQTFF